MYTDFYKFSDKPFQLGPDARFFFNSHGHKRALSYLLYGLGQGEGFIVITGDVGTGKTTLIAALHNVLEQRNVIYGKLVSTQLGPEDLLRVVAAEFDLPFEDKSKASLLNAIESFLKGCVDAGRKVVLLVDEAQNLPRKAIEELRMLSNFSYCGKPLLQSFLLGQREFRNIMRSKEFEQLRQRVIAAYHLRPLERAEVRSYIEHRLTLVGWNNDPMIAQGVYERVYEFTKGVPRKINVVFDRLLLFGAMENLHVLDENDCASVFNDMREEDIGESEEENIVGPNEELNSGGTAIPQDNRIGRLEHSMEALQKSLATELSSLKDFIFNAARKDGGAVDESLDSEISGVQSSKKKISRKKTAKKKAVKKKAAKKKAVRKKLDNTNEATESRSSGLADSSNNEQEPTDSAADSQSSSAKSTADSSSIAEVEFFDVTGAACVNAPFTWAILGDQEEPIEEKKTSKDRYNSKRAKNGGSKAAIEADRSSVGARGNAGTKGKRTNRNVEPATTLTAIENSAIGNQGKAPAIGNLDSGIIEKEAALTSTTETGQSSGMEVDRSGTEKKAPTEKAVQASLNVDEGQAGDRLIDSGVRRKDTLEALKELERLIKVHSHTS